MSKVLAMDLYRLRKGKTFYVLCGIAAAITAIGMVCLALAGVVIRIVTEYGLSGELIDTVDYSLPRNYVEYMEAFFHGNYTTLYIVLWALLFYGAEYKNGFIKNTVTRIRGPKMIFSRLIVLTMVTFVIYLIVAVVVTIGSAMMGIFDAKALGSLAKIFGIGILLNVASASFVVMLFMLWQKLVPAMISGICYVMVGSELLTLVSLPVRIATDNAAFDLNKYLCIGNILVYLTTSETRGTYIRMICIAVGVLAVSVAVSCLASKKKDIL